MNTSQEQLLHLLRLALHGETPTVESFSPLDGKTLFNLAVQQNVFSLIYPTLNNHRDKINIDEAVINHWKTATLYSATRQVSMLKEIKTVLDLLNSNNIHVISVKGLALKQVYPQPELRNMGDLDLFIHEIDIQKTIELLGTLGYHPNIKDLNDPKYMHIEMQKTGSFSVELHRTLWHPTIMKKRDNQSWFRHIWENKRLCNIEDLQFAALSLEDELIHLIIHLARHLMHCGANLQQLCDIVLFIEALWEEIDIKYVEQTIKSMNLYPFYKNIITACHMFMGLKIPNGIESSKRNISEILFREIFNSKTNNQAQDHKGSIFHFAKIIKFFKLLKGFTIRARFLNRIGLY